MRPEQYDAWYATRRGAWIGEQEYRLLESLLDPQPGETLLDAGCGTGYFTRRFAAGGGVGTVIGVDLDCDALRFAAGRSCDGAAFVVANACRLPFRDHSFDLVISVTALCFVREEQQALKEMLRVARRRVAVGLLNHHSLLYVLKGRGGGKGAYRGARWHSPEEVSALFGGLPARLVGMRTAILSPAGGPWSQRMEARLAQLLPGSGGFIAAVAELAPDSLLNNLASHG